MKQAYTIRRGALDGVEAFLRVAERRSFRAAATDLGVTPSAVSQAVRALEARTGIALFARTTRSVGLTEAGQRFLERAQPAFQEIIAASTAASDLATKPSGLLRLAVPRAVVPVVLRPLLASFCESYPDVSVEIAASAELVDLAKEGFDAGIRMGEFIASDMVAVRLTPPLRLIVVGSPSYLARRGRPRTPSDLASHACVRMRRSSGALANWRLQQDGNPLDLVVSGPLIVHDYPSMLDAVLAGTALAQVPEPIAREHMNAGRLDEVLGKYAASTLGVFLYFPDRKQVSPKLRAFIEHARTFVSSRSEASAGRRRRVG
ncbi:MAG TPA: LysR family transcriptional regulator [Rudaea sp.]|jgi:DNA-binding transcriptional LysR family regulator|nr:LysR family transcriptional regulator [Rudaea sp.]